MIARMWRGWTAEADSDAYVDYLNETGVPGLRGTEGNRGVFVLRRIAGGRAEFLVLSLWESMGSITGFAGEDIEKAVFYPEDERFLIDREWTCTHFEVPVAP